MHEFKTRIISFSICGNYILFHAMCFKALKSPFEKRYSFIFLQNADAPPCLIFGAGIYSCKSEQSYHPKNFTWNQMFIILKEGFICFHKLFSLPDCNFLTSSSPCTSLLNH